MKPVIVWSAYHMAKESVLADEGECSTVGNKERMWKALWKLNCPRVVHLFLWKACNNILPTKANLSKRELHKMINAQYVSGTRNLLDIVYGAVKWPNMCG
jgi:hypothetical protein